MALERHRRGGYDRAMMDEESFPSLVLPLGDALVFIAVTLLGFRSHQVLGSAGILRILATLLPFYASWIIFKRWANLDPRGEQDARIWILKAGITATLAAPFGATLRGLWLGSPVLTSFVIVMAGVSALGIMLWRAIATLWIARRSGQ